MESPALSLSLLVQHHDVVLGCTYLQYMPETMHLFPQKCHGRVSLKARITFMHLPVCRGISRASTVRYCTQMHLIVVQILYKRSNFSYITGAIPHFRAGVISMLYVPEQCRIASSTLLYSAYMSVLCMIACGFYCTARRLFMRDCAHFPETIDPFSDCSLVHESLTVPRR